MISVAMGHLIIVGRSDELTERQRELIEDWEGATFYFPTTREADEFINYLRREDERV